MKNKFYSEEFTIPGFLSQKYIPSLDGLRALSIIIVILGHSNFTWQSGVINRIAGTGGIAVYVFYVISGLLITTLLIKEKAAKGSINLKSFYIRRFLRILPVAYLFIIVTVILNYIFKVGITLNSFIHAVTFTLNFKSSFPTPEWPIRHFWTLCVEEQFYFLFPLLLRINYKFYINVMLLMLLFTPVFTYLSFHDAGFNSISQDVIYYISTFLGKGLCAIIIGSLTAIVLCKYPVNIALNSKLIGVAQIILMLLINFFFNQKLILGLSSIISSIFMAIFIFSTIYFTNQGLFKLLNSKIMIKIGVLSYSLYIWQQLFTAKQPWQYIFDINKYYLPLNLVVMVCVAYASYTYFEKPFLKLKDKFSQRSGLKAL